MVRDSSGAVLPGVTVEASSPALIEKVRSAVDRWRRPVPHRRPARRHLTVTFTLTGFGTVKRDGIELTGAFVATVNADLTVGTLEETVTVTGETPIVDVQSMRLQTVMNNDMISALPSSRAYNNLMTLMPNVVTASGAEQTVPGMVVFGGAGGRSQRGTPPAGRPERRFRVRRRRRVRVHPRRRERAGDLDGLVGRPRRSRSRRPDDEHRAERGGNTLAGQFYAAAVSGGMVGSDYAQELQDRGLTTPGELQQLWDFNLGIGGPIVRDRLWYYRRARRGQSSVRPRHVRKCQRGRPDEVDLCGGYVPSGR